MASTTGEAPLTGSAAAAAAGAAGSVLLTLAAAQFLMTLDSSVMNVSIATVVQPGATAATDVEARAP